MKNYLLIAATYILTQVKACLYTMLDPGQLYFRHDEYVLYAYRYVASRARCWALFFQLVLARLRHSPRHVPEGNLVRILYNVRKYIHTVDYLYTRYIIYTSIYIANRPAFLFRPWVFSRALGRGVRKGPPCIHGSSLGPGRGPWRVLCAFKVAKSGK